MEFPACSVVLPTFNRLPYLKISLKALLRVTYPWFEIIVVNDGSTDGTAAFLATLGDKRIRVVTHATNLGLSEAKNSGIRAAQYDYVAFTDDDCTVVPEWLNELMYGFQDPNASFVIGQTLYVAPGYRGYFPERCVQNVNAYWPMGGNIVYKKAALEAVGLFDPDYFSRYNNEDTEMAIRLVSHGYGYTRALEALMYHQPMNWTPRALLRSARNASVWPALKKKYPTHYLHFQPKDVSSWCVYRTDYLFLLFFPLLLPVLLIRYFSHGKRDLKLFFCKWPVWLFLRRYYIYKEAIRQRVFMI